MNVIKDIKKYGLATNNVDNIDTNGNYVNDPLHLYQPIRRDGNKLYFYADVDHYSQLVAIQLLSDIQNDIIAKNATSIAREHHCPENIEIHINSYGGLLSAGLALYDYIKGLEVDVVGIVDGVAMSAATLILLACDIRKMSNNGTVLIHQLSAGVEGTYANIKDFTYNIERAMAKIRNIYLTETTIGMTPEMQKQLDEVIYGNNSSPDEANKLFNDFLPERTRVLEHLLSHDLELDKEECIDMGIIDSDENPLELSGEDEEAIQDFATKLLEKRFSKTKSKTKKSKTKRNTKSKK